MADDHCPATAVWSADNLTGPASSPQPSGTGAGASPSATANLDERDKQPKVAAFGCLCPARVQIISCLQRDTD